MIPSNKLSFQFEVEGVSTGKIYKFDVDAHVATGMDITNIGLLISKHTGGAGLAGMPAELAIPVQAAAYLQIVVSNPDPWLKETGFGLNACYDQNVALALFAELSQRSEDWRAALRAPVGAEAAKK